MNYIKNLIFFLFPFTLTLLFSCDDTIDIKKSTTGFNVIYAYSSGSKFNVLYNEEFSGNVSYIKSTTNLNITNETEFNASTATKISVPTITSDGLLFNNYFEIVSLNGDTTYYIYILNENSGEVSTFIRYVQSNITPGYTTKTGTVVDSITYTLYFPAEYSENPSAKFPLLVSIKGPYFVLSNSHFPCIVLRTDYSGTPSYTTYMTSLRNVINTVINDSTNRIDKSRLYTAGYSWGGNIALSLANDDGYSDYEFSAVLVSGVNDWMPYNNLGTKKTWLYYGENDGTVPPNITTSMHQKILSVSSNSSADHFLTGMPGVAHVADPVWASPYTVMWMLGK